MKLVTLKKEYNLLLKNTITEFLNPNYIYLKVTNNSRLKANPKNYIYRGTQLFDLISSPISGKILGLKELNSVDGINKYMVIENDFKEKTKERHGVRKNINKIKKEELLELLKTYDENIYSKFNSDYKKIMISGVEEQPYIGTNIFICTNYTKEILDMCDALGDILEINDVEILIKDIDVASINSINNVIGMYNNVNVKFLPDKYMISDKEILKEYLSIKEDFLYLDIEEIYNLYQYLKRRKIKEEKFITVTGDAIDNPQVIKCKTGTMLKDIIDNFLCFNTDEFVVIENSLLSKKEIDFNNYVISENLKGIYFMKKNDIKEEKCIMCGKCNEICPVKIKISNLVNGKKCDIKNCINCGLCSYICPSYININKFLNGDKNE